MVCIRVMGKGKGWARQPPSLSSAFRHQRSTRFLFEDSLRQRCLRMTSFVTRISDSVSDDQELCNEYDTWGSGGKGGRWRQCPGSKGSQ